MNRDEIESLIVQLGSTQGGWVGDAQRDVAHRALVARTGLDLGPDAGPWRTWLHDRGGQRPVRSPFPKTAPAPAPLSPEQLAALEQLHEMGVVDEIEFRTQGYGLPSFTDPGDLFRYVDQREGRSVALFDDIHAYARDEAAREHFDRRVCELLGGEVVVHSRRPEPPSEGLRLRIANESYAILERPRQTLFTIFSKYVDEHRPGGRLWLDHRDRVWRLTDANEAAIRRKGVLWFRALNRAALGSVHPDVARAAAFFDELGADLSLSADQLAWNVNESNPSVDAARFGPHSQLIALAQGATRRYFRPAFKEAFALIAALSESVGQALTPPAKWDDEVGYASVLNPQLVAAGSPWRLLAVVGPFGEIRIVPVPEDRVGRLLEVLECVEAPQSKAGWSMPWRRKRRPHVERFSIGPIELPRIPNFREVAPGAPTIIIDTECVDDPDDYVSLVEEILAALADGEIALDSVVCTEEESLRRLVLRGGDRRWEAMLEGDTDWVDGEPLLVVLNEVAEGLGAERRFVAFADEAFGQEIGIAFVTQAERRALEMKGVIDP